MVTRWKKRNVLEMESVDLGSLISLACQKFPLGLAERYVRKVALLLAENAQKYSLAQIVKVGRALRKLQ